MDVPAHKNDVTLACDIATRPFRSTVPSAVIKARFTHSRHLVAALCAASLVAPTSIADMRGQAVCGVPANEAAIVTLQIDDRWWRAWKPTGRDANTFGSEDGSLGSWEPEFVCEVEVDTDPIPGRDIRLARFHRLGRELAKPEITPAGEVLAGEYDVRRIIVGEPTPVEPAAEARIVRDPLDLCMVGFKERRITTIAVVNEGTAGEYAFLYSHTGGKMLQRPERGYSAHQSAFALAGGDFPDDERYERWPPMDTHCEFTYEAPHRVHVYVYRIVDPLGTFGMHPSWFDDVPLERNGLARLAEEIDEYERGKQQESGSPMGQEKPDSLRLMMNDFACVQPLPLRRPPPPRHGPHLRHPDHGFALDKPPM